MHLRLQIPKEISPERLLAFTSALLILIANGTWLQHDNNVAIKGILLLGLFAHFLFYGWWKRLVLPNGIVIFLVLFPIVSTYFVNLSGKANVVNIINTSMMLLLLDFLPLSVLRRIFELYSRMIFVLVCVAVPLGILFLILPSLLEKMPVVYSPFFDVMGGHWYNLILFTERSMNDFRVQSVFWEPGAWAYNQMVAFYYLIFLKNEYKKIPIFLLSILLTLSTSGLMACFICLLPLLGKFDRRYLAIGLFVFMSMVGIASYIIATNEVLSEIFYANTIGKFSSDNVSFDERTSTAVKAFEIANENPLFGIGRLNNENLMYVTSGISEIVYQLGYIYLGVYFVVFIQVFKKLGWLLCLPFCIILLNSEAYSFFSLNMLLMVLGTRSLLTKNNVYQQPRLYVESPL